MNNGPSLENEVNYRRESLLREANEYRLAKQVKPSWKARLWSLLRSKK